MDFKNVMNVEWNAICENGGLDCNDAFLERLQKLLGVEDLGDIDKIDDELLSNFCDAEKSIFLQGIIRGMAISVIRE